jgi:hypothetical protein
MSESSIEVKRTTQVMEVLAIMFSNPKLTVEQACDTVGINKDTYYYWLRKDPDALRAVKDFLADTQRDELAYLSAAITKIHLQLARKALSDDTETADRLKIVKYLSSEAEKLQRIYQVTSGGDDAAEFLKDGPQLTKQKSKFASMTVTENSEGGVNVDFYRDSDIIEGIELAEPLDEPDSS